MIAKKLLKVVAVMLCLVLVLEPTAALASAMSDGTGLDSGADILEVLEETESEPQEETEEEQTESDQFLDLTDDSWGENPTETESEQTQESETESESEAESESETEEESEEETEEIDEGPVSALVDAATTGEEIETITSENELTAMEELEDEGYEETIVSSKVMMRAAAATVYTVSKANTNGTFKNISTHSSFSAAKKAMNSKAASESSALGKKSYVVRYKGRVVAMNSGIAIVTSTQNGTLTFHNTYGGRASYVTNSAVLYYYDTESINNIKVGISGITNYTSYENLMLVPLPFTSGYADKSFNTYEMGYYQKNSSGELVHVVTTFSDKDKTTHYESGEGTVSSSYAVDQAPSFMSTGTKYYSMDGVNFYKDIHLTSKAGTHYNYYQYLSYHTKTSYTASQLNTVIKKYASSSSVLIGQGNAFISAQDSYGINALMELAFACLESGYGSSNYAVNRYNLFGINAGDANPNDASYYSSVKACVKYHAGTLIKQGYLDALTDSRYMGANTGKKSVGVNAAYASDPYHGEKIASIAYRLDKELGSKDYGKYTIGISGTSTPVYAGTSTSNTLYKLMNNSSRAALTGLPVVVLGTSGNYYNVQSDMPIVNGVANCTGTYSYSHTGYVSKSNVSVVFTGSGGVGDTVSVKAPTSPKAETAGAKSIKVSWSKSSDAEGYILYSATSKSGTYSKVTSVSSGTTTYTQKKLNSAATYYYKVRAYKTVDGKKYYSSYTSVVSGTTKPAKTAELKVSNYSASKIKISWSKGSNVTGYVIYRSTQESGGYSKIKTITSADTLSYKDPSSSTGTTYYYKVRAYKTVDGSKIYGAYSDVKAIKAKPVKVVQVAAVNRGTISLKLSWKQQKTATGYEIYRSVKKSSGYEMVKNITKNTTISYTDKGLDTGTTYYYKIRAYKTVNGQKIYGNYSAVVSAKPKPLKISGVKAVSSGSASVQVSWNERDDVSGYVVYRASSESGTYEKVKAVGSGTKSYTDKALSINKTYYYKVRAYKTVNGKNVYGKYSSVVSIKK